MKTLTLFCLLSAGCLLVMVCIDYRMGARAEFLNAWSVVGKTPSAGPSTVCKKFGAFGELLVVLAANMVIGGVLTVLVRLMLKQ